MSFTKQSNRPKKTQPRKRGRKEVSRASAAFCGHGTTSKRGGFWPNLAGERTIKVCAPAEKPRARLRRGKRVSDSLPRCGVKPSHSKSGAGFLTPVGSQRRKK